MKSTQKLQQKNLHKASPKRSLDGVHGWVQIGQLRAEKCEMGEAELAFQTALELAYANEDLSGMMEALAGLLRIAGEAMDEARMTELDAELDRLISANPKTVPPAAWHCKGTVLFYRGDQKQAQRCWNRYLKATRRDMLKVASDEAIEIHLKGWISLLMMWRKDKPARAEAGARALLAKYENRGFKGVNGFLYLLMGWNEEGKGDLSGSLRWFQKAHAAFLSEHNWYYHLYVLLWYARICRKQQNYPQAYWYLDLLEKAVAGSSFGYIRQGVTEERNKLEQDAVDLLVDSRKGVIRTRESSNITFGKQYVLLHILEALSVAHSRAGDDIDRGLSKAEIIERVWKEPYRPESHDNKLYYNINRLRKLIEPDMKNPQYLLNWKEGYRLAPGLRVHFVGSRGSGTVGLEAVQRGG